MYAIQNIKTKKYVYGTDYRYYPPRQRTSVHKMLTYEFPYEAQFDYRNRRCGKEYRIVELKEVEVQRVTNLHNEDIKISLDDSSNKCLTFGKE